MRTHTLAVMGVCPFMSNSSQFPYFVGLAFLIPSFFHKTTLSFERLGLNVDQLIVESPLDDAEVSVQKTDSNLF